MVESNTISPQQYLPTTPIQSLVLILYAFFLLKIANLPYMYVKVNVVINSIVENIVEL